MSLPASSQLLCVHLHVNLCQVDDYNPARSRHVIWHPSSAPNNLLVGSHLAYQVLTQAHVQTQAMSSAQTGLYCGPLRLLAMEVYDSLNAGGTLCNLLTGKPAACACACM